MSRIFVSYRRGISSGWAGRLSDRLRGHFGPNSVFTDIDTIGPGVDFFQLIRKTVGASEILLAIIAPDWLNARDEAGRRRLDDSNDLVRTELAIALSRNILVVPVLVGGADMPKGEELPADIQGLARRNAHELTDKRWDFDTDHLVKSLERTLGRPPGVHGPSATGQTGNNSPDDATGTGGRESRTAKDQRGAEAAAPKSQSSEAAAASAETTSSSPGTDAYRPLKVIGGFILGVFGSFYLLAGLFSPYGDKVSAISLGVFLLAMAVLLFKRKR